MAKVNIDTDLMNNELLPMVTDEVKHINNALSNAQTISFPDSGFGWGNIINNISECVTLSNKYSNWINRVYSSYNKNIIDNVDALTKLQMEEVKKRESIVK